MTTPLTTAAELLRLSNDGHRHELVQGELHTMPLTGPLHGWITARIASLVTLFVDDHRLGSVFGAGTGFLIATDPDTVLAPDLAFVRKSRVPAMLPEAYLDLAPDLAVEVMSPRDIHTALRARAHAFLEVGSEVVWVIDPRHRTVSVYRRDEPTRKLHDDGDLSAPDLLPGWSCPVRELLPD